MERPLSYPHAGALFANLPDLEWLWKGWLPRGLVSLLAATPGTGKSYFALDLAQRVITCGEFPDGSPISTAGKVLYVDAENTPMIFKKRVSVWDPTDLKNLYMMLPDEERMLINLDGCQDSDRLWDMVYTIQPTLVIVDSYGSVTLRGENNKEDVQMLLSYFNRLADGFNLALLLVHHLRKGPTQQTSYLPMTLDSIRGSSHIPAMARNVLGLQLIRTGVKQDLNGPRRL